MNVMTIETLDADYLSATDVQLDTLWTNCRGGPFLGRQCE